MDIISISHYVSSLSFPEYPSDPVMVRSSIRESREIFINVKVPYTKSKSKCVIVSKELVPLMLSYGLHVEPWGRKHIMWAKTPILSLTMKNIILMDTNCPPGNEMFNDSVIFEQYSREFYRRLSGRVPDPYDLGLYMVTTPLHVSYSYEPIRPGLVDKIQMGPHHPRLYNEDYRTILNTKEDY